MYRTYFINSRGDEAMGTTWSYLDMTALGRQETWEDSPEGYPQTPPYKWWNWHDNYDAEASPDPKWVEVSDAGEAAFRKRDERNADDLDSADTPSVMHRLEPRATPRDRSRLRRAGRGEETLLPSRMKPVERGAATTSTGLRKGWLSWLQPRNGKSHDAWLPIDPPRRAFVGVSALLFAGSATLTIVWCTSMSAMGGMPMPGGWTMSMAWMRMPGQTWPGAAASFLGMWVVMMVAMMLPSLVPMLRRYRQAVGRTGETRLGPLTAIVGAGYFFVWTVFGMAVFPLGAALAAIEMQQPALARAVPIAAGVVVLIAGALQFSAWKARHLACCREAPGRGRTLPADAGTAWRHGLRLGLHCSQCCAGPMAILLVIGVMDLRAMAVAAAAITVERLAPAGERVARTIGAVVVGAGLFLIARAAGPGTP